MNNLLSKYQFNDPWALWMLMIIPISLIAYYFFYSKKNETLKIISKKKKIYPFGSGVIAEKTISNLDIKSTINGVFDNSKTLWNTKTEKIKIN